MKIFRKRYIPEEIVDISGDEVLFISDEMIITKWIPIKPRIDFAKGISYIMMKKGWKISKFFDKDDNLNFWYCDIIDVELKNDVLNITDLLIDVKVYKDGTYEILDLDELDEALEKNLITTEIKEDALEKLKELENVIKAGAFPPFEEKV